MDEYVSVATRRSLHAVAAGVRVTVGVRVSVGVRVIVGVRVSVGVPLGTGVFVAVKPGHPAYHRW